VAVAASVLVLAEDFLSWRGVFQALARLGAGPQSGSWSTGGQIAIRAVLGIAIGLLVIIGIANAVLGLVAWRRGVLGTQRAAPEYGPAHAEACERARADHGTTLWRFLVLLLVAIGVVVALAGVNAAFFVVGLGTVPGTFASIATNLATVAFVVAMYYVGTRNLAGLLSAIASPGERTPLGEGRTLMLGGRPSGW
jgi:hypothetical protein